MVRDLGVPAGAVTALESRHLLQRMVDYMLSQGVRQFLDRFTLVEPGLVTPGEWRPDLDNPLRAQGSNDSEGPVIHPLLSELPRHDDGIAWHFCGIGVKD
jgi:hypothetical protein